MAAAFKGFSSIKTNARHDSLRLEDMLDVVQLPKNKYFVFRILPIAPLQVRQVWIQLWAGGKGKEKRIVNIPRYAIDFDPNDPETPKKGVKCPFMELAAKFEGQKDKPVRYSDFWLCNVIDREKQDDPPRKGSKPTKEERKTGFKDINSDSWTPVRVLRLTATSINRLTELSGENRVKDKKSGKTAQYDASDARYGFDVKLKYKPDAPGTDKYQLDPAGGPKKLTDEEKSYLVWNLTEELLDATGRMKEKAAREDVKRMEIVGGDTVDDDDDDDDDDSSSKKKSKKSTTLGGKKDKKKSNKSALDGDDDDDDDDDDDSSSKKKSKKSKEKSKDKPKKSSKKVKEDDEPKKKKKKEDDEPKKKKKGAKEEKSSKKSKKEEKGGAKKKPAKDGKKSGKKKSDWDDE